MQKHRVEDYRRKNPSGSQVLNTVAIVLLIFAFFLIVRQLAIYFTFVPIGDIKIWFESGWWIPLFSFASLFVAFLDIITSVISGLWMIIRLFFW